MLACSSAIFLSRWAASRSRYGNDYPGRRSKAHAVGSAIEAGVSRGGAVRSIAITVGNGPVRIGPCAAFGEIAERLRRSHGASVPGPSRRRLRRDLEKRRRHCDQRRMWREECGGRAALGRPPLPGPRYQPRRTARSGGVAHCTGWGSIAAAVGDSERRGPGELVMAIGSPWASPAALSTSGAFSGAGGSTPTYGFAPGNRAGRWRMRAAR